MKKSTKNWLKQKLAWLLIVLMSINSFGAVVGDSDGPAFTTKDEFEKLKSNFENQIINYTGVEIKIIHNGKEINCPILKELELEYINEYNKSKKSYKLYNVNL